MSSSLGGVSRRSGLAACACRKGPSVSSGPPAMGGRGCPEALPLWTLCSYLGVRGFDPQATEALSLLGGGGRDSDAQHAPRRAPPSSGGWGRPLAPLERSECSPPTAALSHRLHSRQERPVGEQTPADQSVRPPAPGTTRGQSHCS